MVFDNETEMPYPTLTVWGVLYAKTRKSIVQMLSHRYSHADREDAVEFAYYKLMFVKDRMAYGDKLPRTEAGWVKALYWQARSYLSHLREHGERHAKYVEETSKMLADILTSGHRGQYIDADIRSRALARALEMFRRNHDISRRDLAIYTGITTGMATGKELAARYHLTPNNVFVRKCRVGHLLRKYGPGYFDRALDSEDPFTPAA
ncbi:MAG: hypothetical protein IKO72_13690 [Kiritimatiellae bacterium]|nr:hypothetical protein [Kiritimatiellia bacterium]